MDGEAEVLIGAWRLERWEIVAGDGTRRHPFGAQPAGLLIYTADGCMSACIMAGDRPALSAPNPRRASAAERAAAFDGYFSYAGRYRVSGSRVLHEIEIALNPAMVGTPQWRDAQLAGSELTLSASEPAANGGERLHRLVWRRVQS